MHKLSRTAKHLDIIFRILLWLLVVLAAGSAVAALAPLVLRLPAPSGKGISLDLDFVKLHLSKPDQTAAMAQQKATLAAMFLMVAGSGIAAYCIKLVRNILKPMIQQQPFHNSVYINLKKLGWVSLIGGVVMNGIELLMQHLVVHGFNLTEMLSGEIISKVTFNYSFDLTFLLISAGLFLMSYIFRYGAELQQLSDETL